jgi:Papain-like cysteine protease AvrRpt2
MIKNTMFISIILLLALSKATSQARLQSTFTGIPQRAGNWCWAASLEMVVKYYQPSSTLTQYLIAKLNPDVPSGTVCWLCPSTSVPSDYLTCSICTPPCANCIANSSCNKTMSSLSRYKTLIAKPEIRYNADTYNGRIPTSTIENEINNCKRPLILIYKNNSHASPLFGTDVTGAGYIIHLMNPKDPACRANQNDFNYSYTTENPELGKVGFVYNLYSLTAAATCTSTIKTPVLRAIKKQNIQHKEDYKVIVENQNIPNGIYKKLKPDELQKLIDSKEFYPIPIRYISTIRIDSTSNNNLRVMNILEAGETIELVSESEPHTSTVLKKINGVWIPMKISPFNKQLIVKVNQNDSSFELDNRGKDLNKLCDNGIYEHIRYVDLEYDFYRFCINGTFYIIPFYDYSDLQNIEFSNNQYDSLPISERIYKQKDILSFLKISRLKNKV